MQRVAEVIHVDEALVDEYERLHAECWPEVLNRLRTSKVTNYSIYRHGTLLFSYFEYTGDDYAADMAAIAGDPVTQRWWRLCRPMQHPVEGRAQGEWWHALPEIFHLE